MANRIGDVLDIESPESYIKRPVGPMVTVEVKDINKLAGIIRIPSMAEGPQHKMEASPPNFPLKEEAGTFGRKTLARSVGAQEISEDSQDNKTTEEPVRAKMTQTKEKGQVETRKAQ
ncbi:unnamed protein product [Sphagnum jensenii]|uniref:Uncharacterized protein n=1 Tax=Sphagnum jensenii TaxID=128206 RepID=A0ABP1AHB0_9BRYO